MKALSVLIVTLTLLVTGCGSSEPTLDASSDEALEASLERMHESLPEDERAEFEAAMAQLTLPHIMAAAMAGDEDASRAALQNVMDDLHGMTASEVVARAESQQQN